MKIDFFRHGLDETDIANAAEVMRSVFLTTGPVCAEFERRFAAHVGLDHAVSLASCTAALHLSLLALGVGPGDEVITTPMTFIATATAILHTGAKPVFADIEPETGLIDPASVEAAITPRTKAILPVHLYGVMADMRALKEIADQHSLHLVEDAAHCIEGERDGVRPGDLSAAACYSFYATKNLTCGEGGALATQDKDLAKKVRSLRQHGMSKEAADRHHGAYQHWDMIDLGWKYNLDDIRAALLMDQMTRLPELWLARRKCWEQYEPLLAGIPGVTLPQLRGKSAHHLLVIRVPAEERDNTLAALHEKGVGVAVNYRAIHTLTWFRQAMGFAPQDFPRALEFGNQVLSLPFYPAMPSQDIAYVCDSLRWSLEQGGSR